jgi:N-acetylneuraminic acid mutarotase
MGNGAKNKPHFGSKGLVSLSRIAVTIGVLALSLPPAQGVAPQTGASSPQSTIVIDATAESIFYQGRLTDSGSLASGNYDFQFLHKEAATGGNTVGEALKLSLPVQGGVFSTSLSWSPSLFPGSARWIEVQVRPTPAGGSSVASSEAPYAVLERQRVHSTPYSFRSLTSATVESVPIQSLPARVPLIGTGGKLDSALLAADIARSSDISAVSSSLQDLQAKWLASQVALSNQLVALAQENALLKESVQVLSAPTRSGWMAASFNPADPDLMRDGFVLVSTVPSPGWTLGSQNSAPTARLGASSVWTGEEWIVWGGLAAGNFPVKTGARYRPDLDLWSSIAPTDAPGERSGHSAVWTGKEMIVWGGVHQGNYLNEGARYNPNPQGWVALKTTGAPSGRTGHSAAWTGRYMVVFGGRNSTGMQEDGGLYDPSANSWTPLTLAGSPPGDRMGATMIWTGNSLIVWGGFSNTGQWASGAVLPFNPQGEPGAWTNLVAPSGFSGRMGHVSAWDGQRLMVWGGRSSSGMILGDGAVWDSVTGVWTSLETLGAPTPRYDASGAWTGDELVVFGGSSSISSTGITSTGAAWRPGAGWRPLSAPVAGVARSGALATWTGSHLLMFGGTSPSGLPLADLQRLEVRSSWYLYRRGALPKTTSSASTP